MSGIRRDPSGRRKRRHHGHKDRHGHHHRTIVINNFCNCCPEEDTDTPPTTECEEVTCTCQHWIDARDAIIRDLPTGRIAPDLNGEFINAEEADNYYCHLVDGNLMWKVDPQEPEACECQCWKAVISAMAIKGNNQTGFFEITQDGKLTFDRKKIECSESNDTIVLSLEECEEPQCSCTDWENAKASMIADIRSNGDPSIVNITPNANGYIEKTSGQNTGNYYCHLENNAPKWKLGLPNPEACECQCWKAVVDAMIDSGIIGWKIQAGDVFGTGGIVKCDDSSGTIELSEEGTT